MKRPLTLRNGHRMSLIEELLVKEYENESN